jgi:hypothetical protein
LSTPTKPPMHEYFAEAEPFLEAMEMADNYGLRWEFVAAFLKDLGVDQQRVFEATIHARREWDLG